MSHRGGWRRLRPRPRLKPKKRQPLVKAHLFKRDDAATREPYTGLDTCLRCGQLGEPGDRRHTVRVEPPPQVPAHVSEAWRKHDAAVLGETGDER